MAEHAFDLHADPLHPGIHAIEASAGTGKTYTLAQLVVRLVVEKGLPIDQILTVTFTRAAAAELRERIFARLSEVLKGLSGQEASDPALQAWIARLLDPDQARHAILQARLMLDQAPIHTIDAFAMQVAREHALSLGLPWDATLLEDPHRMDQQLADSLWHTLTELPDSIQQAVLSKWPSPDALYERFRDLGPLARFDDSMPDWKTLWQQREVLLAQWPPDRLQAISFLLEEHARKGCKKNSLEKCTRMILDPLRQGLLPQMEGTDTLLAYLNKSLRKDSALNQLPPELLAELEALDETLQTLPDPVQLAQSWFAEVHQRWKTQRQQQLNAQGLFTYDTLKHTLADAVSRQETLRQQLQNQYRACLIDEFQDTDPDQWKLFGTLFGDDRHHLFLIGDPKQAIYGFRGANLLTYFEAVARAQYHHTLDTNYRSHPQLVEGFNLLFGELDGTSAFLDARCTAPALKSARSARDTAFHLKGAPCNVIRILEGVQLQDRTEATLAQLCRDMVQMLAHGQLREGNVLRPVQACWSRATRMRWPFSRPSVRPGFPACWPAGPAYGKVTAPLP